MPILAKNKRANYDYKILSTYEAGLVLLGCEVKSIKTGHISLKGSYVTLKQSKKLNKLPELYLINAHIPLYKFSNLSGYDPYRSRKLLLKKGEISRLIGKKQEQGLTLIPIKIYTKNRLIKLEFGLGQGKKKYDKREDIKKREVDKKMRQSMRQK